MAFFESKVERKLTERDKKRMQMNFNFNSALLDKQVASGESQDKSASRAGDTPTLKLSYLADKSLAPGPLYSPYSFSTDCAATFAWVIIAEPLCIRIFVRVRCVSSVATSTSSIRPCARSIESVVCLEWSSASFN